MVNRVLLIIVMASCHPIQKPKEGAVTFADMSLAERLRFLDSVLVQQIERIKKYRLDREADPNFKLGLRTSLRITLEAKRGSPSVPKLVWDKIVADRLEIIRCQVENIENGDKVTGGQFFACEDKESASIVDSLSRNENPGQCQNFDELLTNSKKYNFLRCDQVYGKIEKATTLMDYSAPNGFKYIYFLRPCIDNYTLVTNIKRGEAHERCGIDEIRKIEQGKFDNQQPVALVKKICNEPRPQICSDQISQSVLFNYNQGRSNKPQLQNLFAERNKLATEITNLQQKMIQASNEVLRLVTAHNQQNADRQRRSEIITYFSVIVAEGVSYLDRKYDKSLNQGQNCMAIIQQARERGQVVSSEQENDFYMECLANNANLIKETYQASQQGTVDITSANFAIVETGINMLPLENSYLAKDDVKTAVGKAVYGIFAGEDTYFRQHCEPCLNHVAKVKKYFKEMELRYIELANINQQLASQVFVEEG